MKRLPLEIFVDMTDVLHIERQAYTKNKQMTFYATCDRDRYSADDKAGKETFVLLPLWATASNK